MASSSQRMIHQDYIARIRFSNALPPPPIPPKLLDMPSAGLASGQYTSPGFASRLAREQPLNIEADAELGMPLDLVGMPGIFDGDESSIQAPAETPIPHPRDRALLRPLTALGRPKPSESAVSFLRRTEYISSQTAKRTVGMTPRALLSKPHVNSDNHDSNDNSNNTKRPAPEPDKDSPAAIRRKIDGSFAAAARFLKEPSKVKHPNPSKRAVRLLDARPLLPDVGALPDSGAYVSIKFQHNPVPSSSTYDSRLLAGLLRPIDRPPAEETAFQAALQAHVLDPENNAKPPNLMNYDFYLAMSHAAATNLHEKLDVDNPARDDDALYTTHGRVNGGDGDDDGDGGGDPCFQFSRVRAYETATEVEMDHATKYDDEIILAFEGGEGDGAVGVAAPVRYYPVMQRSTIRSQRNKNIARKAGLAANDSEQVIDRLEVTVEDPSGIVAEQMDWYNARPTNLFPEKEGENKEGEGEGGRDDNEEDDERRGEGRGEEEEEEEEGEEVEEEEDMDPGPRAGSRAGSRVAAGGYDNDDDDDDDDREEERLEEIHEPDRSRTPSVDRNAEGDED